MTNLERLQREFDEFKHKYSILQEKMNELERLSSYIHMIFNDKGVRMAISKFFLITAIISFIITTSISCLFFALNMHFFNDFKFSVSHNIDKIPVDIVDISEKTLKNISTDLQQNISKDNTALIKQLEKTTKEYLGTVKLIYKAASANFLGPPSPTTDWYYYNNKNTDTPLRL